MASDSQELSTDKRRVDQGRVLQCRRNANLTQPTAAKRIGIGLKALCKLEKSGGVLTIGKLEAMSREYGIAHWSELVSNDASSEALLFQTGGLLSKEAVEGDFLFQDFVCDEYPSHVDDGNCPVALLWADARRRAHCIANVCYPATSDETTYLRIAFRSGNGPYPANVGIHPKSMRARKLNEQQIGLRFRALLLQNDDSTRPLSLVVRLSDGKCQVWEYHKRRMAYCVFSLGSVAHTEVVLEEDASSDCWRIAKLPPASAWTTIEISTLASSDDHRWMPFNHEGDKPSLDVITRLTLEFGHPENNLRPRGGGGVVLISPIEVVTDQASNHRGKAASKRKR